MRRATTLLRIAAAATLAGALAACSSSGETQATSSSSSTPTTKSASVTCSTAKGLNPNSAEGSAAGDIPDNQAFVTYSSRAGTYTVKVPEGWARTETSAVTTFTDHFNSILLVATKRSSAPTVATAQATDVPALRRNFPGFTFDKITLVSRAAGSAVLVNYRANSPADPVTGKRIILDVERYEFWRNGTQVAITLSAPQGSDNVDPWKKVTDSFAWSR